MTWQWNGDGPPPSPWYPPYAMPQQQQKPKEKEKAKKSAPVVGGLLVLTVLVLSLWGLGWWVQRTDTANMVRQQRQVEEQLKQEAMR